MFILFIEKQQRTSLLFFFVTLSEYLIEEIKILTILRLTIIYIGQTYAKNLKSLIVE